MSQPEAAARCPQPGALGRPGEGGRGREHCPREGARPRRRGGRSGPAPRETVTETPGACSPLPASVQLKPRPDFAFRTILSLTFRTRKVISGSSPVLPLGALSPSSTPPSLPRAAPGDGAEAARGLTSSWAGQRPSAEQAAREPRQHSGLPAPGSAAQTVPHEHPGRVCADICATPNYAPSGGLARALNSDPEPKEHLGN